MSQAAAQAVAPHLPMKFSDAEWRLMTALWARNPASARDVHDAVSADTGWAYSTVKTMLSRLVEKGALAVEMVRNAAQYTPNVSQEAGRRSALRTLINQAFGGSAAPLMAQLLGDDALSARDRAELSRLLQAASPSAPESKGAAATTPTTPTTPTTATTATTATAAMAAGADSAAGSRTSQHGTDSAALHSKPHGGRT